VLCGMSMGGFMALRFAERYPDRLEGLVLIDAMAEGYTETEREEYRKMLETAHENGFSESMADMVRSQLFGETTREENPELTRRWAERWQTYPVEAFDHELHSWIDEPDFTPQLSEIHSPVLSVHGEEDVSIEPERTESMLEALPDARQKLIPNAGHSSNLENPAAVNDAIRGFLDDAY